MNKTQVALREIGRACVLVFIVLFGGIRIMLTQASSPNYSKLFGECLVLTIIHNFLGTAFFLKVCDWTRWVAIFFVVVTIGSLLEMMLRVCFGIRVL